MLLRTPLFLSISSFAYQDAGRERTLERSIMQTNRARFAMHGHLPVDLHYFFFARYLRLIGFVKRLGVTIRLNQVMAEPIQAGAMAGAHGLAFQVMPVEAT